ncbi:MAG: translation initiation factor, partial [Candidatus Marinimicrobia bacterium]|nr:translation initiation factor [Candidatus Neomarinimicrobiota bacterium]
GGSVKNRQILIQGNHREKIIKILDERGFKVKASGG